MRHWFRGRNGLIGNGGSRRRSNRRGTTRTSRSSRLSWQQVSNLPILPGNLESCRQTQTKTTLPRSSDDRDGGSCDRSILEGGGDAFAAAEKAIPELTGDPGPVQATG